jgi:hypothetical protein
MGILIESLIMSFIERKGAGRLRYEVRHIREVGRSRREDCCCRGEGELHDFKEQPDERLVTLRSATSRSTRRRPFENLLGILMNQQMEMRGLVL